MSLRFFSKRINLRRPTFISLIIQPLEQVWVCSVVPCEALWSTWKCVKAVPGPVVRVRQHSFTVSTPGTGSTPVRTGSTPPTAFPPSADLDLLQKRIFEELRKQTFDHLSAEKAAWALHCAPPSCPHYRSPTYQSPLLFPYTSLDPSPPSKER